MLQKASSVPLESIKRRFYQAMEDTGNVWADMWRVYYNTDRLITVKDDNGEPMSATFNGEEHKDIDMRMKVDIGPSSSYSESLMMTSLDKLFDGQFITIEQYLKYAPQNVIPFKDRLLKDIQAQQEQQAQMQQQQMAEQDAMMQQQQQDQMMQEQQAQAEAEAKQPHPFDQVLQKLPKHQQDQFKKLDPKQQDAIMQQLFAPKQ